MFARNPLAMCAVCAEHSAKAETAEARLADARGELARKDAELAAFARKLTESNSVAARLADELAQPRDAMIRALRARLRHLEEERDELIAREMTVAGEPRSGRQQSQSPRPEHLSIEIFRGFYPKNLISVGLTETIFLTFADYTDMPPGVRQTWVLNGRVSARFFVLCMEAVRPSHEWKRRNLVPADGGSEMDYFFWKVSALGSTLDLVILVSSFKGAAAVKTKSHIGASQIAEAVADQERARQLFFENFESGSVEYLENYARWPPRREYSKVVPAEGAREGAGERGREGAKGAKGADATATALALAVATEKTDNVLVDYAGDADLFANADTRETFREIFSAGKKRKI